MNNIITTEVVKTMTSLEIGDLVESRHDSVKRTIERCAEKGVFSLPPLVDVKVQRERREETVSVYQLCKRDSLIVVAQLCPEYTARIVDRWQELEEQAANGGFKIPKTMPEALRLAADLADKVQELEVKTVEQQKQLEVVTPKAHALDRFATFAEGSMCITNAAKALQVQPKKMFEWLKQKQWIYRRAGGAGWIGYQSRIQVGYLEHKVTTVERGDGSEKTVEQVLITAKGLAKLATDFGTPELMAA